MRHLMSPLDFTVSELDVLLDMASDIEKHPEKYASAFYTLIPEKRWNVYMPLVVLKEYANGLGGQMAYWDEQALEWAQRLFNGESWEDVCNNADTAREYRMIIWKNGLARLVGGSRVDYFSTPASEVEDYDYYSDNHITSAVPLVVFRKK